MFLLGLTSRDSKWFISMISSVHAPCFFRDCPVCEAVASPQSTGLKRVQRRLSAPVIYGKITPLPANPRGCQHGLHDLHHGGRLHSHNWRRVRRGRLFRGSCLWALLFFTSSMELVSLVVLHGDMYEGS